MTEPFLPDAATRAQIAAADPQGSVWLTANAGSGKTKVLTDRVAWLLLSGAAPERILCLTFTRAAAAEMQNRLAGTLGAWAMMPDDALREALTGLGVRRAVFDTAELRRARTLFARAIETPGGLRIQTIHAFCASLLRRFPLEAGIAPGFREMDEIAAARLLLEVLEAMAADPADAPLVEALARRLTAAPDAFLASLARLRPAFREPPTEAALRELLDVGPGNPDDLRAWAIDGDALDLIEQARDAAGQDSTTTATTLHADLSQAILADPTHRFAIVRDWLLTKAGTPRKQPLTKRALAAFGGQDALGDLEALAETIIETEDALRGHEALARTQVLHAFAARFLARLDAEKAQRGWLDYDDLVLHARALLSERATAQWVLYKLDGGIDHVLVDEAQDTSQVQWDVIAALTDAFGGGQGAREAERTLFVVGDAKQSIFSFQGADPAAFRRMRDHFGTALTGTAPLTDHALRHSFRSSPVILSLVDRVFAGETGAGGPTDHIAFKSDLPGRVDLWPHVPEPEKPAPREWFDPVDRPASDAAHIVLARQIADGIARMIADEVPIVTRDGRRPVEGRDVLILFRARDRLFDATIEACKAAGLPMAGADRLRLASDLAVKDLLSLMRVAATPEDDLSLAEVLRSPLGGLSEGDLYAVAQPRDGTLFKALRDHGGFARAAAMLDDVLAQADFLRPYEMLQRILIRHDGRRLLTGRLGMQVGEAIDGLLQQALAYEALQVPSLTGFLGWIEEAEIEIKREATGDAIRVMSVHGAKGLESPVVILPQCGPRNDRVPPELLRADDTVLWRRSKKGENNAALAARYEAAQARAREEGDRLLYVALTRAESWLICASAGTEPGEEQDSWRNRIEAALEAEGAVPLPVNGGQGLRLEAGDWTTPGSAPQKEVAPAATRPDWPETPAPAPARPAEMREPSDLGGDKVLFGASDTLADRDAALRHGSRVHALLEHLRPGDDEAQARALIDRHAPLAPGEDAAAALAEALAVRGAHPALFAPGTLAELPFVLAPRGDRPGLTGTMDRVIVTPESVTIVDFKTNRIVPATPADTPEGLLRQMGAYAAAATAIWPGRQVETAILWTATNALMALPHDLVNAAWSRVSAH